MSKMDEFYESEIWMNIEPIPGAKDALERLVSKGYLISVVTARGEDQKDITEAFLAKWFPGAMQLCL